METNDTGKEGQLVDTKPTSLRIVLSEDVMKKINVIAPLIGIDGKKADVVTKVCALAINHYYKEVTVPELQSLTTKE